MRLYALTPPQQHISLESMQQSSSETHKAGELNTTEENHRILAQLQIRALHPS